MDGIGYWVFLMILYLISSWMKKRKQSTSLKEMEDEENPAESPSKLDEILQVFNLDNVIQSDGGQSIGVEASDEEILSDESYSSTLETKDEEESEKHIDDEHFVNAADHTQQQERKPFLSVKESKIVHEGEKTGFANEIRMNLFHSSHQIKHAILLKEILDKPRAIRRTIR